jgi:glycosyltransferase involved in cell wall biosynthesis
LSATAAIPPRRTDDATTLLAVRGVRNPRSEGISRYAKLLADALADEGIAYGLDHRAKATEPVHFHLGNSSRALLRQWPGRDLPFVVTVHDVVPRSRALLPLYRALAYPQVARRAGAAIVHSAFAADLLVREAGRPRRLEVIAFPAGRPQETDRSEARRALGWPVDSLIAVLPGVIRPVKLAREALAAVAHVDGWQLALAGRLADRRAGCDARDLGALVLANPDDRDYERAIVAADCVLCLRSGSVGETNFPLLDALGAGRAVLATATGSIPEVATDAAAYCAGTEAAIRSALNELADPGVRAALERLAAERAAKLTWAASATLHADLFREVLGV